ncbi:MAG: hypothetical protein ACK5ND_10365, partial [Bacteroides sp.]
WYDYTTCVSLYKGYSSVRAWDNHAYELPHKILCFQAYPADILQEDYFSPQNRFQLYRKAH